MEDRVKHLELVTTRLMRRANKHVKAVLTPYPISNATIGDDVQGVVLRYMFPCKGRITKGAIDIGIKPKSVVAISISLTRESGGESRVYKISRKSIMVDIDVEVEPLDKLEVSVSYTFEKPEEAIKEFWISMLWIPTPADTEVKRYLVEDLENDIAEIQKSVNTGRVSGDAGGE